LVIDVATNTSGPEIKVGCNPLGVAITPDGRTAYVTNQGCGTVTPIELATNTPGQEIKAGQGPLGVAVTPPAAPTAVTEAASAVTEDSGTLNAMVNPNGELVGECKFEYGTSTSYGAAMPCLPSLGFGPSPVAVSAVVTGLSANTEYHFRISATGLGGMSTGGDEALKTLHLQIQQPPEITAASLTSRRFRVARQTTAISAARPLLGTLVRFTLSAAAKLQIAITRSVTGLRHGHRYDPATRALKRAHARRCTRTLTVGTLTRSSEPQGADHVLFSGRIGHRALTPGSYDAVLQASNAAGHSMPVTLSFLVVRS
jgi:YVTN family beta-propeller protein